MKDFVVQGGMENTRAVLQAHAADRWVRPLRAGTTLNSATTWNSALGHIAEGIEVLEAVEKEDSDGETPKRRLEIIEASLQFLP